MTDEEIDARWIRGLAARKALMGAADDLFLDLCELEGGLALIECTAERNEVLSWVLRQPRFDRAAREAALYRTK